MKLFSYGVIFAHMRDALNPFTPGYGTPPPALVGRDDELESFDVLVERAAARRSGRGMVLTGLRGVGKTVLLNQMRRRAEAANWFTVSLEARRGKPGATAVRKTLARELAAKARIMNKPSISDRTLGALRSVAAFNVRLGTSGIDLGVEIIPGRGDSGAIDIDVREVVEDLAGALSEEGRTLGLFIDELQDLDPELLSALLVTQHAAAQDGWSFYIIAAGLPGLPARLADAHSYAERMFDFRPISSLPLAAAAKALEEPLALADSSIAHEALPLLLQASSGYPFFLQTYGQAAWQVAEGPQIDESDAVAAVVLGRDRLDAGFFRARWDRATPAERRMLVAMAEDDDDPSSTGVVAARMGTKVTSIGPHRASLIGKGLIYAPEHGQISYTVPGMAAFVHRHRDDLT